MKRRSNNQNGITKAGDFSQEKLENSKNINEKDKKSHKKAVWQEKTKFWRVEARGQYVVGGQKYSIEMTFKKAEPKKILIF